MPATAEQIEAALGEPESASSESTVVPLAFLVIIPMLLAMGTLMFKIASHLIETL